MWGKTRQDKVRRREFNKFCGSDLRYIEIEGRGMGRSEVVDHRMKKQIRDDILDGFICGAVGGAMSSCKKKKKKKTLVAGPFSRIVFFSPFIHLFFFYRIELVRQYCFSLLCAAPTTT